MLLQIKFLFGILNIHESKQLHSNPAVNLAFKLNGGYLKINASKRN